MSDSKKTKKGLPPRRKKRHTISITLRIDIALHEKIKLIMTDRGNTLTELTEWGLEGIVEEYEEEKE